MITINNKSYKGNNISIIDNIIYIDGKKVDDDSYEDSKVINIIVNNDIDNLIVDNCDKIEINGGCKSVTSKNGNIVVKGDVSLDVSNKNGNIICRNVGGDVTNKNGDIIHS